MGDPENSTPEPEPTPPTDPADGFELQDELAERIPLDPRDGFELDQAIESRLPEGLESPEQGFETERDIKSAGDGSSPAEESPGSEREK